MNESRKSPRPKRLRAFEKKNKKFLDGLEPFGTSDESHSDQFVMPYTTRPALPSREWKLTGNA